MEDGAHILVLRAGATAGSVVLSRMDGEDLTVEGINVDMFISPSSLPSEAISKIRHAVVGHIGLETFKVLMDGSGQFIMAHPAREDEDEYDDDIGCSDIICCCCNDCINENMSENRELRCGSKKLWSLCAAVAALICVVGVVMFFAGSTQPTPGETAAARCRVGNGISGECCGHCDDCISEFVAGGCEAHSYGRATCGLHRYSDDNDLCGSCAQDKVDMLTCTMKTAGGAAIRVSDVGNGHVL
jgi:hypothetical protein